MPKLSLHKKLFPTDKNFILKEVQLNLMAELLYHMVDDAIKHYQLLHNPLGLIDNTIIEIKEYTFEQNEILEEFYVDLAGIYRYHYGENQLEFLFDGTSHHEKFTQDWRKTFGEWMKDFYLHPPFLKAVLEATVFNSSNKKASLVGNRLKIYLSQHFHLKVYKYKGIQKVA